MVEASPAAALVMSKAEFLLEFLVIALDPPAQLGQIDQPLEGDVVGKVGEPIFGRLLLARPPFDLVAEGRDREIDTRCTICARLGLGVFDRPGCVAVLLPQLGRLLRPLRRDAAFLDLALLAVGVALLRRGDDRGVDDNGLFLPERGLTFAVSTLVYTRVIRRIVMPISSFPAITAAVSEMRRVRLAVRARARLTAGVARTLGEIR
jgi:hypothetical protein